MTDNNPQPLIAIDFDGTLCASEFPACGPPMPGAREALELFHALGYRILVYSCRTCHWHPDVFGGTPETTTLERVRAVEMREWLLEHQMPFDEIDDGSKGKPFAAFYIDDKGIRYDDNWPEVAAFVLSRTKKETD